MLERVLALDVGDRRIGIAVSDPLGITAQGLETYHRKDDDPDADADYIAELLKKYAPVRLVCGLPKNMDGTCGFQADKVRDFAAKILERWNGTCEFYDERLTTVSAERVLLNADVSRKKRKQVIDKLAAVVILQNYLDSKGR
ncbi:MAG: Holliday junction resolvase RuvX [Clostridia bacterium]|nr:Holliday junction resolvase RuvX [Clostridia bacterium]